MSSRKLLKWQDAGLIDAATRERIEAWEAEHSRPLALWAAIGIGALAIGLGVISVVAANWEEVPGQVRLALHLVLLAGLAGFIWLRGDRLEGEQPWGLEAAVFVFAILGMTFFGHIGQVYQTSSPLWQPLAAWLLLFAPLLLMRGQSWLAAALLFGTLAYACWDYVLQADRQFWERENVPDVWYSFVTAAPVLVAPVAAWMRERDGRTVFWKRLEQATLAYALGGASLICIAAGYEHFDEQALGPASQAIRAALGLVAATGVFLARKRPTGQASASILAAAGLAGLIAVPVADNEIAGGLLFMALWLVVAAASLKAGWRGAFQLAVAAIALRLIILSFELASDLLTSGFGLILAGMMVLAVAWGALRVSREFAPTREEEG